ncbi:hypothetical protein Tco_0918500 [Tanacetum coccineum]
MSPSCSARIAEVAAMSDVAFRKRFRSPYESLPSPSPTLPVRKRYRGTSELVLSTDSEANELGDEEDSLDSESGSEGAEDKGPAAGDEDPGMRDEGFGLGEDEDVPKGQQRAASVVEIAVGEPLGLGYGALRRRELAAKGDQRDRSPIRALLEYTQRLDMMPPTLFTEIDRDVRELYTRSGEVRDETFSQRYRLRSLEQERAVMTFGALWRPVLTLEAWAGHVHTRMMSMSQAEYDDHRLVHDLLVQQAALQR